jgi:hypothetical protein
MAQDNRSGPPSRTGKPGGGDRRDGRPRGPGGKGGGRGGPGRGGDARPARVETYDILREVTRGSDFRIDKFVAAEKGTHKPVHTEYRLTREGLAGTQTFSRLGDAQKAATEPLPEPVVEEAPAEVAVEDAPPEAHETEAHEAEAHETDAEAAGGTEEPAN